jgi:flavin reductase (DIM6/NTAB) family NADH-FMN oxidoreductase RutF
MDPEIKKQALREVTYGLYIVSAIADGVAGADTVNWLSQASFSPPLVMVGIKQDSNLHAAVDKSGSLVINILSASQKEIAQDFFRATTVEENKLNGHSFTVGVTGAPVLDEVYAYLECQVRDKVALGDHTVVIAEVVEAGHRREDWPLEMWGTGWLYGG